MLTRKLFVLALILGLLVPAMAAAAPLAVPCVPGASYNPACDANQDGSITVTDLQLTAGHWNQSGTFVSDSNHTHLGQTWTGANNPLKFQGPFGAPDYAPIVLNNTQGHGLAIPTASINGIYVGNVGAYGMVVNSAVQDGVYVGAVGSPSSATYSGESNGFEVAGAGGSGLYVGRADTSGVYIASAGLTGVTVHNAPTGFFASTTSGVGFQALGTGSAGYAAGSPGTDGLYVIDAGSDGVEVWSADGNGINAHGTQYGGYFWGNIYVDGVCISCRPANFAVNAGGRALQPGDVVSVQGVTSTDFDTARALWQAVPAEAGQAAVGVVAGKAELVIEENPRPSETGKRLVPREGAARPGEYVTIVFSGPMQVKVAHGAGAVTAGTQVTVAADGSVRPLGTMKVQLADGAGTATLPESAPVLGVALASVEDGLVWVLVNP
jgi:hypothetical protein